MFQNCSHKSISINLKKGIRGFTLIELLIVMAIIGVLAGISLFAMKGARESARDTRRKADLEAIRSALELYKADCNRYVPTASFPKVGFPLTGSSCSPPNGNVYLQVRPGDPMSGRSYAYSAGTPFSPNPTSYILCAALEGGGTDTCSESCGVACNYKVTNP